MKITKALHLLILCFVTLAHGQILGAKSPCHVIFDAGSSGTRLYIYQEKNNQWITHKGPKTVALADPIRQIQGKTWADRYTVVNAIIATLDTEKHDFNWPELCQVKSASINGTAGMRLAEQAYPNKSKALWGLLHQALTKRFPPGTTIKTQTITGFEEGVYQYLGLQSQLDKDNFGVIEVGGASLQVIYPCPQCHNATTIQLNNNKTVTLYGDSFLGLGIHEAYKLFGQSDACQTNEKKDVTQQAIQACGKTLMATLNHEALPDPYNFRSGKQNKSVKIIIPHSPNIEWYIRKNKSLSTFKTAYSNYINQTVSQGKAKPRSYSNWTKGYAICESHHCLRHRHQRKCRWLKNGCLTS